MRFAKFCYPLIIFFCLLHLANRYAQDDLRRDEAFSFRHFVFEDFHTTLTYYPEPNNHIFFSLYNNVLSRILGIRDFHESLDHLSWFRWAQLLIAFGTLFYVFLLAKRFFNLQTAWISLVILITTIPFLNFMMQLRGYNFSMFFAMMTLYHSFVYLEDKKTVQLYLFFVASFLLLYTIPSNIYFYFSLLLFFGLQWMVSFYKNINLPLPQRLPLVEVNRNHLLILATGIAALILTFLCYLPVLDTLLYSKTVTQIPNNRFFTLSDLLPQVLQFMVSGRDLLIGLALAGGFVEITRKNKLLFFQKWAPFCFLLLMPFVFSFLRNDLPFQRTFVVVAPIFALVLAIPIAAFFQSLALGSKGKHAATLFVYAFSIWICFSQLQDIQIHLKENLTEGKRERNLYYNFYQSDTYQFTERAKLLAAFYEKEPLPVMLMPRVLDGSAFVHYLDRWGIENYYVKPKKEKKKQSEKYRIDILSSSKNVQTKKINKKHLNHSIKRKNRANHLNKVISMVDFMHKERKADPFYVVSSYHKIFQQNYLPHLQKEFKIKRLTKDKSSINLYLFKKRKLSNDRKISPSF